MMWRLDVRFAFRGVIMGAVIAVGAACGDASAPPPATLTGEYVLTRVGDDPLPLHVFTYADGSYEELDRASLRFLSRSRVKVASTTVFRWMDNTYRAEVTDSLVFEYVRKDEIVELTLRDTRGVFVDTLQLLTVGTGDALRVLTTNYAQTGFRRALVLNGFYLRSP